MARININSPFVDVEIERLTIGSEFYWIEVSNTRRATVIKLSAEPWRTNMSYEPRIYGFLGSENGRSAEAFGKWRITTIDGGWITVQELEG